jgi:hypothetical protein
VIYPDPRSRRERPSNNAFHLILLPLDFLNGFKDVLNSVFPQPRRH